MNELLKHVADKLGVEIEVMTTDISRGACKDFGDYKWATGIVRGLQIANGIIADTAQQVEEDD